MEKEKQLYICPYCSRDVLNLRAHYNIGCSQRKSCLREERLKTPPSQADDKGLVTLIEKPKNLGV